MKKDILKAIEIEKTYIDLRLKDQSAFSLIDELKRIGFNSLEEYFDAKRAYKFSQLDFKIYDITSDKCLNEGLHMLREKITGIFFVETEGITIYSYKSKPYNKQYCQEHNLTVYELPTGGGTIVSNNGDIAFGLCLPNNLGIESDFILNMLVKIIKKYMKNVSIADNDILVNGGKVCGLTYLRSNEMIIFLAHFSFSDNSELIEKICNIESKTIKKPSYITGLDKHQLKNEVIQCLQST